MKQTRAKSLITALVFGVCSISPPAGANDGPIRTGAPCVPTSRYTSADSLIFHTGLKEDTFNGSPWHSFDCFYYVMAWILGRLPADTVNDVRQVDQIQKGPLSSQYWTSHKIPGNAYLDNNWLTQNGYNRQFVTRSVMGGPVGVPGNRYQLQGFKPGDIILVPGSVPSWNLQSYVHAGIVTQTDGNGNVVTTRQKINPWTCVQDLTPDQFDLTYGVGGPIFEVWRKATPISQGPNRRRDLGYCAPPTHCFGPPIQCEAEMTRQTHEYAQCQLRNGYGRGVRQ
jgi:hypothetical protein